ncbi:NifU family protein [Streptosporangium sp. NBC_01469]|uniref:NifU family protein n=1 Tax=Streptosporangium sp. NBC_01469 TaxID=2903898 RepID=UPI002E28B843|nr:NifU family protein [Streptosporangium sp. NBC_01469]
MPQVHDVRATGDRVEALIADLGALSDAVTRAKAEDLVRALVELYGAGLERVVEIVTEAGAAEVLGRMVGDPLVSGLLVLHDLHPLSTAERVRDALDTVRPHLGSHEGGVELLGVGEDGIVRLRLEGTCHGCPSSRITVTDAIERAIAQAAPEVAGVEVEGVTGGRSELLQIQRLAPGPCPVPEQTPVAKPEPEPVSASASASRPGPGPGPGPGPVSKSEPAPGSVPEPEPEPVSEAAP